MKKILTIVGVLVVILGIIISILVISDIKNNKKEEEKNNEIVENIRNELKNAYQRDIKGRLQEAQAAAYYGDEVFNSNQYIYDNTNDSKYAYYDINNNGTEELIVINNYSSDSDYKIKVFVYYENTKKVEKSETTYYKSDIKDIELKDIKDIWPGDLDSSWTPGSSSTAGLKCSAQDVDNLVSYLQRGATIDAYTFTEDLKVSKQEVMQYYNQQYPYATQYTISCGSYSQTVRVGHN